MLATDAIVEPEPRAGALLAWPVEWIEHDKPQPKVSNLHCTLAYWPEVAMSKDFMLGVLRDSRTATFLRRWELGKVVGVDAFGEEGDYPVLLLEPGSLWTGRTNSYQRIVQSFQKVHQPDQRWEYTPHISVDLKTCLNPPKEVVLRPVELWYKDDEPVAI